jgi:alkyl hydroperoxide reductase subunit AhpC
MLKKFFGRVEKGKLILNEQDKFNLLVWSLSGKEVEVTLGKVKKTRSNQENKYMWSVPYQMIADETGMTPEEVHDAMRMKFLLDRSKKIPTIRSTTELTTVEFETYMSQLRQFGSEFLGIYIPEPNECKLF